MLIRYNPCFINVYHKIVCTAGTYLYRVHAPRNSKYNRRRAFRSTTLFTSRVIILIEMQLGCSYTYNMLLYKQDDYTPIILTKGHYYNITARVVIIIILRKTHTDSYTTM